MGSTASYPSTWSRSVPTAWAPHCGTAHGSDVPVTPVASLTWHTSVVSLTSVVGSAPEAGEQDRSGARRSGAGRGSSRPGRGFRGGRLISCCDFLTERSSCAASGWGRELAMGYL